MRRWLGAIAIGIGLAVHAALASEDPAPLLPLTDQEQQRATAASATAIASQGLADGGPLVLVGVEPVRSKESSERRLAIVTHYRYRGDLTIATTVDLADGRIIDVTSRTGVPAPLAKEELEQARELALADPKVAAAIPDREGLVVEALLIRAASPNDRLFGKRAVRLLFKQDEHYLSEPIVEVDLSSRLVFVEERRGPTEPLSHH